MAGMDWTGIGGAVTAIGIGIGGVYTWWLSRGKKIAAVKAEIAAHEASADTAAAHGAVADAQQAVYRLLLERVTTLEKDMRLVREELAEERQHSRRLVLHIWRLEQLMRAAGLEVPAFVDGEMVKP